MSRLYSGKMGSVLPCIQCLYQVGFGKTRISRFTTVSKSTLCKWIRKGGINDSGRRHERQFPDLKKRSENLKKKEDRAVCLSLLDRKLRGVPLTERQIEKRRLKARGKYQKNRDKLLPLMRLRASARWEMKKKDAAWLANRYAIAREWRKKYPERVAYSNLKWRAKNPRIPHRPNRTLIPKNERRIVSNLRGRLRGIMRGTFKGGATSLIGCTSSQLALHLEAQFKRGMSWANYGQWHIDHIYPCAAFDLTDVRQQRACFHWTNLQPLWAKDNIKKGDKRSGSYQMPLIVMETPPRPDRQRSEPNHEAGSR